MCATAKRATRARQATWSSPSAVAPQRGQVAIFEGTLRADDDIGIGYKYPVLLEDATVIDH